MTATYPAEELKTRAKQFAIRVVRLFQGLPKTQEGLVLGKQVLRSGTSIAANCRAECRSRSKAEFTAKIGIVVEGTNEKLFWLELLVETGIVAKERMEGLLAEANELLAIFAAAQRTARTTARSTSQ